MSTPSPLREDFARLMGDARFLRRVLVHFINNRVHDFPDPLTTTLILMCSNPVQLVFCESGLLLFRTTALPVFPFGKLRPEERAALSQGLRDAPPLSILESVHGCGKFTVQAAIGALPPIGKRDLLMVFVEAMTGQTAFQQPVVMRRLCDIVIQRYLSAVTVPSEDIRTVTDRLWEGYRDPPAAGAP